MTRYKAFSKHPTGIDIPFRARSLSGNLDGAFLFFFFLSFFLSFEEGRKEETLSVVSITEMNILYTRKSNI